MLFFCVKIIRIYRQKNHKYDKIHLENYVIIGGIMDIENLSDNDLIEMYQAINDFINYLEKNKN